MLSMMRFGLYEVNAVATACCFEPSFSSEFPSFWRPVLHEALSSVFSTISRYQFVHFFGSRGSIMCVCVYIYIYAHTHTHTHIYIYSIYMGSGEQSCPLTSFKSNCSSRGHAYSPVPIYIYILLYCRKARHFIFRLVAVVGAVCNYISSATKFSAEIVIGCRRNKRYMQ